VTATEAWAAEAVVNASDGTRQREEATARAINEAAAAGAEDAAAPAAKDEEAVVATATASKETVLAKPVSATEAAAKEEAAAAAMVALTQPPRSLSPSFPNVEVWLETCKLLLPLARPQRLQVAISALSRQFVGVPGPVSRCFAAPRNIHSAPLVLHESLAIKLFDQRDILRVQLLGSSPHGVEPLGWCEKPVAELLSACAEQQDSMAQLALCLPASAAGALAARLTVRVAYKSPTPPWNWTRSQLTSRSFASHDHVLRLSGRRGFDIVAA